MVMTSTIDKIIRVSRPQSPERYRRYLEQLPAHQLTRRLDDLLQSEAAHGHRALDERPEDRPEAATV